MRGLDLRDGVKGLVGYANRDLGSLWREVRNAAEAETALRDILPALIDTYGAAAGTLAADWYDDLRDKVDTKARFRAIPADIPDSGAQSLVGWALDSASDYSTFQTLIAGGLQRRIANFSRGTITGSSVADPGAIGWQRVGSGECDFCTLLIGRGAVYTEASADFASHDHCNCGAAPAFDGESVPVKPYTPGPRDRSKVGNADFIRAREYIATH